MTTHAIIMGGILKDGAGRPLGPYRLRTAAAAAGYRCHVIDYAWALSAKDLLTVLESQISNETLVLGISNVWFTTSKETFNKELNAWFCDEFFEEFHRRWPWIQVVIGGTKIALVQGAEHLKSRATWWLTGFADIGFIELLKYLQGQNSNFKFEIDHDGCRVVDCNVNYKVNDMDQLETVFEKEDKFLPYQPMSLEASRGCIFTCSFCSHPFLGKKVNEYMRSPESIARELRRNYELFGTTRYQIMDDTFNDSMEKLDRMERAIELAKLPSFEFCSYIRAELIATKPEMIPKLKQIGIRGGTVGLESLNPEARRAVGKGMDIERVMEALSNFKENSRVLLHTGMIIGLPGDTIEDAFSWAERFKQEKILSAWTFQQLGLTFDENRNGVSIFEKDPAKWGYKILGNDLDANINAGRKTGPRTLHWENNRGVTNRSGGEAAAKIMEEANKINTAGGFSVGEYWFHGASDSDLVNKTKFQMGVGRIGNITGRARARQCVAEAQEIIKQRTQQNTP